MKKTISAFQLLLLLVLMTACGNNGTDMPKDEIFNDPAIAKITDNISRNPENAELYFKRGLLLIQHQKDSLALNDLKKAVSLDSGKAEYYSAIGDLLFEHKDLDGSVQWLEKALAINPKDIRAHLKVAKMSLYLKEYGDAFKEINTVLRQDVYNPEAYFLKGLVYKDMNDTAKAISSFETAVQVSPDHYNSIIQLGLLHSAKKQPVAIQYFENAWSKDTTDVFPLFAIGFYYQNTGDYKKAKEKYIETITKDRSYIDAYINYGHLLVQQDSFEKAWRQYDLLTKISPDNPEAYYNRGFASEMMKKKEAAIEDYKQALVFDERYQLAIDGLKRLGGE